MKRKKSSSRMTIMSPINPSIHFILFLILAFVLVVIVGYVMRQTAIATRARIICGPQSEIDPKDLISELSRSCPNGVEYVKDNNGCNLWVCRKPAVVVGTPLPKPKLPAKVN